MIRQNSFMSSIPICTLASALFVVTLALADDEPPLADCDSTVPDSPMLCGTETVCPTWLIDPCTGNGVVKQMLVRSCTKLLPPDQNCSILCATLGDGICAKTLKCTVRVVGGMTHCSPDPNDPALDANGNPVVSTAPRYGTVSCRDKSPGPC